MLDDVGTSEPSCPPGSNETDLLSGRGVAGDGGGVANVLLVSSSVGMLDRVHGNTTDLRPAVALGLVLVVRATGLEHGLLGTSSSSHLTDGCTASGWQDLLAARGQLDTSDAGIGVVGDDDGVVSGGSGNCATVSSLLLKVADDGSLRHGANGLDVADMEGGVLATVDELTAIDALCANEVLLVRPVPIGVPEVHLRWRIV